VLEVGGQLADLVQLHDHATPRAQAERNFWSDSSQSPLAQEEIMSLPAVVAEAQGLCLGRRMSQLAAQKRGLFLIREAALKQDRQQGAGSSLAQSKETGCGRIPLQNLTMVVSQ